MISEQSFRSKDGAGLRKQVTESSRELEKAELLLLSLTHLSALSNSSPKTLTH
jgi:hypothetical protein